MQTVREESAVVSGGRDSPLFGHERKDSTTDRLAVTAIRDVAGFSRLRDEWDALVLQSEVTPFQTFEWLFTWWNYFGEGPARKPHILLFRDRGTLAGIVPLFLEVTDLFGKPLWKRLRFMGCGVRGRNSQGTLAKAGPSDFLDFIIHPSYRPVVPREFARYLDEHRSLYDDIELEHLPGESAVLAGFLPALRARKIRCATLLTEIAPRLEPPGTLREYLEGLRPHVRRKLNQAMRAVQDTPGGSLESARSFDSLMNAFRDLVALHQARWNRLGHPGLFFSPGFAQFQEAVLREFWNRGWISCRGVRLDGKLRAVRLGFAFKGRLYDYLSGFDDRPPWSKSRPGLALLLSMIEHSIQSSAASLEFLRGTEEYKFELTSGSTRNSTVWAISPGSRRSSRRLFYRFIRWIEALRIQLAIERSLFQVQRRRRDFPLLAAAAYAGFRMRTLRIKIYQPAMKEKKETSGSLRDSPGDTGAGRGGHRHEGSQSWVQHGETQ